MFGPLAQRSPFSYCKRLKHAVYKRAIELAPGYPEAHYNLAIANWRRHWSWCGRRCVANAGPLFQVASQFNLLERRCQQSPRIELKGRRVPSRLAPE